MAQGFGHPLGSVGGQVFQADGHLFNRELSQRTGGDDVIDAGAQSPDAVADRLALFHALSPDPDIVQTVDQVHIGIDREEGQTFAHVRAEPLAALDRGREVLLITAVEEPPAAEDDPADTSDIEEQAPVQEGEQQQ